MRKGAGLEKRAKSGGSIGHRLDRFAGTWTAGEAKDFDASIRSLEQVDGSFWK